MDNINCIIFKGAIFYILQVITAISLLTDIFMILRFFNSILIFLPIVFLECSPPKKALSNKDSNLVQNLLIFPTYSKISVIEKGDKRVKSESFSGEAESEIKTQLINYIPSAVTKKFLESDSTLKENINTSGIKLIKSLKASLSPRKVEVPGFLLNILDSLDQDYGLLIVQDGFTRTSGNLKTQYIKRKEIALATLGFYNTEPNSSYSVMIGVLIDKKRKQISLYKELYWRNKEPNDKFVIRSQIRDIILYYFQTPN